ncbi:MAG: ferrous iron transporter B [Bdellovibrionales bacterium]|nr:ferrous iron transporter B [Bdellovibrionales bacterium]
MMMGAPNAGKTTLFNELTSLNHKTVNYPGSTIDYSVGKVSKIFGSSFTLIDAPGTYSLFPKSPEEKVAVEALYGQLPWGQAQTVLVVMDGTQLSRHLYLLRQLIESQFNIVVAVTMADLLFAQQCDFDEQKLEVTLGVPVVALSSHTGEGLQELVDALEDSFTQLPQKVLPPPIWDNEQKAIMLAENKRLRDAVLRRDDALVPGELLEKSEQIDRYLLHPVLGPVFFILIMALIFISVFWMAAPPMDWIDGAFAHLSQWIADVGSGSLVSDFLAHGMVASIGAVLVFVPQILILFFGISLLEESGYLARACSLIDKPLSALGLNGRSFVPLLSGNACAIPAMMAARTIPSKREKWITLFIVPLMSCSARLPVYALLLSFLFWGQEAWKPAVALVGIYGFSLVIGALFSSILHLYLPKDQLSFLIHELPAYRKPMLKKIVWGSIEKTWSYVKKAGPIIFVFAVILWIATTFPNYKASSDVERLDSSYAAAAGQWIEPLMKPMGVDWRVGTGLVSAFAAREIFVSAMALMFHVTEEDEDQIQSSLLDSMRQAKTSDGKSLFTVSSVIGLIIFFVIALQCMSTVGVARKEFGSWKAPILQLILFNLVAYTLAVVAVQSLRLIGFA